MLKQTDFPAIIDKGLQITRNTFIIHNYSLHWFLPSRLEWVLRNSLRPLMDEVWRQCLRPQAFTFSMENTGDGGSHVELRLSGPFSFNFFCHFSWPIFRLTSTLMHKKRPVHVRLIQVNNTNNKRDHYSPTEYFKTPRSYKLRPTFVDLAFVGFHQTQAQLTSENEW